MRILNVTNAHVALPHALALIDQIGVQRESRNGPVLVSPEPITTVYAHPCERVVFWPTRDPNPFFHLFESLWMLAGRNDVTPLCRYVKSFADFSDDGILLHGAYGHRWRQYFQMDQLAVIAEQLKKDPTDRRNVLQMWNSSDDLGIKSKDIPCNLTATFQRGAQGELNLVVFNRSNDIILGCYGANVVHFSILLEYMALWIGCPIGTYTQVSVNWHAYLNKMWKQVKSIRPDRLGYVSNPYNNNIRSIPMKGVIEDIDEYIKDILYIADSRDWNVTIPRRSSESEWIQMVYLVLKAHHLYTTHEDEDKYTAPLRLLVNGDQTADWIVASTEWIQRRYESWKQKQGLLNGDLSHQ